MNKVRTRGTLRTHPHLTVSGTTAVLADDADRARIILKYTATDRVAGTRPVRAAADGPGGHVIDPDDRTIRLSELFGVLCNERRQDQRNCDCRGPKQKGESQQPHACICQAASARARAIPSTAAHVRSPSRTRWVNLSHVAERSVNDRGVREGR